MMPLIEYQITCAAEGGRVLSSMVKSRAASGKSGRTDDRYVRPMALGNIDERELLGYLIHSTVACRADKVRSHSGRGLSAVFQTPVVSSFALASEE